RRERSRASVESTRALTVVPKESDPLHRGLYLSIERGPLAGQLLAPTHQAFGQICSLAATPSPASYFRESRVPSEIIADALNYNLRFTREVEDVGVLATIGDEDNGLGVPIGSELRAATGPAYGRIWDADIVDALVERFGAGWKRSAPSSRSMTRIGPAGHIGDRGRPREARPGRSGSLSREAVRAAHGGADQGDPPGRRGAADRDPVGRDGRRHRACAVDPE